MLEIIITTTNMKMTMETPTMMMIRITMENSQVQN